MNKEILYPLSYSLLNQPCRVSGAKRQIEAASVTYFTPMEMPEVSSSTLKPNGSSLQKM